ncbi:MAG TPA: DUF3365 domain-containing protein [Gammaproteobacteria bacterium]
MKRILLLALTFTVSATSYANDNQQRVDQSKAVVKEFMTELKGELEKAMKEGGPVNAIGVCNLKAPEIATRISEKHQWDVARTSLKLRNTENKPDAWEEAVLNKFEARKAAGEAVEPMAYFEVVEENNKKYFRFMKAIPTGEVCLKCHGSNIDPKVVSKLDALYPSDKARGYSVGDIRGAFTIKQPM